jgi:lipopolysaccharide/colanic/teichoic acid biosynthesis glycosyltransferase
MPAIKRIFDITVAFLGLLILSPLFIVIGILVSVNMGLPVLFTQIRPGKDCKPFKIYKFRSMTNQRNDEGKLLPNKDRITKFGHFLRTTSLDELPELFNVLKGDMSLVGPRPLLMDYVPLFNDFQNQRHIVKPGITGWAQINGRNAITWDDKFELDIYYVRNQNLRLDIKILFLTVFKVLKRVDISHRDTIGMPRFDDPGMITKPDHNNTIL